MLAPDPVLSAVDDAVLELAVLERMVDAVPVPATDLPGWQSLAAVEYARAVHELVAALAAASSAFAAARAAA